eukprot:TRINITY_DN10056_c0_g1_i1.p1 TRINITY_DN10056_c0_g1~~TRINITY_DN10056_c0_g1_i1.p1  ORF type:complete len:408 (+),score=42.00 TRINITY_DN10056_c0_g1_i1:164-1387(+)
MGSVAAGPGDMQATLYSLLAIFICLRFSESLRHSPLPGAYNIVWNAPANGCERVYGSFNLTQYGILENTDDAWQGDEDTLFYKIGSWPVYKDGIAINGGLPQNACLPCHLQQVKADVEAQIPDPDFSGIGIIDFEAWRPLYAWNYDSLSIYQRASINFTHAHHPNWTNQSQILEQAKADFNLAARDFFLGTLEAARSVRPKGLWGYYQFPYCSYVQNDDNITVCNNGSMASNDKVQWLWDSVDILFPEIYQYVWNISVDVWQGQVAARVEEAVRLAAASTGNQTYVLPYGTPWSTRPYANGSNVATLIDADYLNIQLHTPATVGADGVVLWGSSGAVRSKDQCLNLENYIRNVLGPMAQRVVQDQDKCSATYCSNNGTCVTRDKEQQHCRCYLNAPHCANCNATETG